MKVKLSAITDRQGCGAASGTGAGPFAFRVADVNYNSHQGTVFFDIVVLVTELLPITTTFTWAPETATPATDMWACIV